MYTLKREIPVDEAFDVVVAGGGPAGCAAAISAGRLGGKVLLLESVGCLGGMGTTGMVCAFDPMANGETMLVGGVMREIVETLYARGYMRPGIDPDSWRKRFHVWSQFNPEGLKMVLDEMALDAGVTIRFFTRVMDADMAGPGRVKGVITTSVEGYRYIPAKAFIDCTGDAVLSVLCGAPYRQAGRDTEHIMPSTLTALFAGVDYAKPALNTQTPPVVAQIEAEYEAGNFEQVDRHLVGISQIGRHIGYLNGGHIFGMDATNVASLTNGMIQGRRIARQNEAFLKKYAPNCADMELVTTPVVMGVRESRRVLGEYELNFDDYIGRRQFPDQIGVFNKFVDIHPYDTSRAEYDRLLREKDHTAILGEGECFGMPYGMLVPRGFENLWVAGRCASSDVMVHGSVRVMPAAAMMGQAAGTAAMLSIQSGATAQTLRMDALIDTLREAGAYLPQAETGPEMTRTQA